MPVERLRSNVERDPIIRRATGEDAAAIARCYRRAYAAADAVAYRTRLSDVDAATVASWLQGPETTFVAVAGASGESDDGTGTLADPGGDVVGAIQLRDAGSERNVERLAVVPERQGEGIATRLLDRVEAHARDRGDDRLRLATVADHPFLVEWYGRRGYETVGTSGSPALTHGFVLLEKSLAEA